MSSWRCSGRHTSSSVDSEAEVLGLQTTARLAVLEKCEWWRAVERGDGGIQVREATLLGGAVDEIFASVST